ncbi:hypothetical protein EOA27_24375 [Mesorhizobium sp. M2A.F.Ca.ET.037.01.1.1]|uniref:hypothetical protein n=1 Tax=Mesorhizobium sp. M2A.F.Ca.ET.037.01.1.1 TaxID=2496748 RepID=UPI000FCA68AE|nr:hypothetical protein [Mesorhizobium sp. M2A.F.Ca.ET.037.01.1.1]RUX09545.1 hypothetical protein EOA27_24375 [Mesorhizobium sp. M2A.F.Ca.ET.037.01.1.1]
MTIDVATPNRAYPLPFGENNLKHDVARVIAALQAIDVDVAAILTALVQKAPSLNAALSGTPTAPTPGSTDNSTRIATTQWVRANFADFIGAAPAALDTIAELAAALQNNPDIITQILTSVGLKAPLASPALTGVPTAPTAAPGTNTTQVATTGFVKAAIDVVLGGVSAAFDTLSEIAAALATKANLAGGNAFTGAQSFASGTAGIIGQNGSGAGAGLSIATPNPATGAAAFISLNRTGAYAVNFGLDTDNKLKVGGWSMGAAAYEIVHMGNVATLLDTRYAAYRVTTISTAAPSGGANGDLWFQV